MLWPSPQHFDLEMELTQETEGVPGRTEDPLEAVPMSVWFISSVCLWNPFSSTQALVGWILGWALARKL